MTGTGYQRNMTGPCHFGVLISSTGAIKVGAWYSDNMQQHTPFEILLQLRMLDAGLVPHTSMFVDVMKEVRTYMASMDPAQRRIAARKFRKMWRKAAKDKLARANSMKGLSKFQRIRRQKTIQRMEARVSDLYNKVPSARPTRRVQRERAHLVLEMFLRQIRQELSAAQALTSSR